MIKLLTTTLIVLTLISLLILYLTTPSTKTTYHQDWDLKLTELPSQDNPDTCEPFNQAGYLNYDPDHILDNNCPSSFIDKLHHTLLSTIREPITRKKRAEDPSPGPDRGINVPILIFYTVEWWAERVTTLLKAIDTAFPSNKDNATAPILWRSLHHTRRHSIIIHTLKNNETIANPSLANRLKFDNWGRKMLGFENHFRDPVHPKAVPGSVLWSDMMLWELRKAVAIPSPDDHSVLSSSFKHSGQSVSSPHSSSS
ncbi:hypothetical protein KEM48_008983 [Puccinia striiformis f. sp. tritici PST-130]|nr:hypothetical protein KEM48_008983 [Puccinia striiformis f. sp. tritici PST-130]